MKTPNLQTINAFVKYLQQWYPKTKIVLKSQSKLMVLIGFILKPFNPSFMTGFITTIGNTMYVPDAWMTDSAAKSTISTLSHEIFHVRDFNLNPVKFTLGYLFPLLPFPSYWRMLLELKGYTMSMATFYWGGSTLNDTEIEFISKYFTGGAYGFMWPFKKNIISRLNVIKASILNGSFLIDPLALAIQSFYLDNSLMNDNLRKNVSVVYTKDYFDFNKKL